MDPLTIDSICMFSRNPLQFDALVSILLATEPDTSLLFVCNGQVLSL
jgi:hypothetical protein